MKNHSMRYLLSASALATSVLGFAVPAHAFEFKVSGQVDRAITAADNGKNADVGFVDNTGSNTRFRFTGEQTMSNGLDLGFTYEIGLGDNASSSWDINQTESHGDFLDNRKAEVYLKGDFGRLTMGKGNGAANFTSEVDYSGTEYLGGGVPVGDYASGIQFINDDGDTLQHINHNTVRVGKVLQEFDGLSRSNRVRYDTPSLGGAVFSASIDEGHAYELAARYHRHFSGGGKFGMALDYVDSENQGADIQPNGIVVDRGDRFREYGGSASLLLASGLNFTVSIKKRQTVADIQNSGMLDQTGYDAMNYFGGIGYIVGRHHFQINYDRTRDFPADGVEGTQYGAAYVFDWTHTVQLYASYHLYSVDLPNSITTVGVHNISQLYLGTRVKFL